MFCKGKSLYIQFNYAVMKYKFILLVLVVLMMHLSACTEDEPQLVQLRAVLTGVYDIEAGEPYDEFYAIKEDGHYKCSFTTVYVRKSQTVTRIDAKYIDDELWVTAKLDKDGWPETLDRMVRIEFNLYDLPKGKYDLVICVENAIGINRDQKSWEFD